MRARQAKPLAAWQVRVKLTDMATDGSISNLYRVDAVVRRAAALQATALAGTPSVALHPDDATASGLVDGMSVSVKQGSALCELPLKVDARVARGAAWIPSGFAETSGLDGFGTRVDIGRAGGLAP